VSRDRDFSIKTTSLEKSKGFITSPARENAVQKKQQSKNSRI